MELLSRYNFSIEHSAGKTNEADGLSRRPDLLASMRVTKLRSSILASVASSYWEDPWFQDPDNRQGLEMRGGIWYQGDAVVIPA